MRVPRRSFAFQFKNEKQQTNYMNPNHHLLFKLKMRNEKRVLFSFKFIFKLKQQLKTYFTNHN